MTVLGVVMDPAATIKVKKDSTLAMLRAATIPAPIATTLRPCRRPNSTRRASSMGRLDGETAMPRCSCWIREATAMLP